MNLLETASLRLTGALPWVEILDEPAAEPRRITPSGWPEPARSNSESLCGPAAAETWTWPLEGGLVLDFTVERPIDGDNLVLSACLTNNGPSPVILRSIGLISGGALTRTAAGGSAAGWVLSPIGGAGADAPGRWNEERPGRNELLRRKWAAFGMPVPQELPSDEKSDDGRWRSATDGFGVCRDGGREALVFQAVGPGRVEIHFDYKVDPESLTLEISALFGAVRLDPGETRVTDGLFIVAGPWNETCDEAFRHVAATHGSRVGEAPVGWCSWYDLLQNVTSDSATATAEAMRAVRRRAPLDFIQLDDGHQTTVGEWTPDRRPGKFPAGLTPFVAAANAAGAAPGIWLAPLAVHESSALFKSHSEWMQRDAMGAFVEKVNNWGPTARWMDPTHPGAAEWIRNLLREFRRLGFTYFKIDFNTVSERTRWHDPKKTRLEVFRDLYRLYREELGEGCHLLACGVFTLRAPAGFADSVRIGPDSGAVWEYGDYSCAIHHCVKAVVGTMPAHRALYINDPDVTYLRTRDTLLPEQLRSWHGFVGLSGGLVAFSEPMHRADFADALPMLQILIPPLHERSRALGGAADFAGRRFGFLARRPFGDFAVIQVHNPSAKPSDETLHFSEASLGGPLHVWSFWDTRYHGIAESTFTVRDLPARGAQILRLTPVSHKHPVLVGSDLHIGCGASEIEDFAWDADRCLLTIRLNPRAGRDYGGLWIAAPWQAPDGLLPDAIVSSTGLDAQPVSLGGGLYLVHLRSRAMGSPQNLCLKLATPAD